MAFAFIRMIKYVNQIYYELHCRCICIFLCQRGLHRLIFFHTTSTHTITNLITIHPPPIRISAHHGHFRVIVAVDSGRIEKKRDAILGNHDVVKLATAFFNQIKIDLSSLQGLRVAYHSAKFPKPKFISKFIANTR